MSKALVPVSTLPLMTPEELADASVDDKRAEAWLMASTGRTQKAIAEHLGVSRTTVQNYLRDELQNRLSRRDQVEEELERIIGSIEQVANRAQAAHESAPTNSLAGSNYLRLRLDALREIARLRGIDSGKRLAAPNDDGTTEVVVRVGGAEVGIRG